jgi:6-phosphogluconolactonase (cycloisomerase 2 family)
MKTQHGKRHVLRNKATPWIGLLALPLLISACSDNSSGGSGTAATVMATTTPVMSQLYTQTNESSNSVVHYGRLADGTLVQKETTLTGGVGTAAVSATGKVGPDSIVSQHSIILSTDHTKLFVVNAGDNSISVMAINQATGALSLLRKSQTAGIRPNSLSYNKGIVYVTFFSGSTQLAAFSVQADGTLLQIGDYNLTLGGPVTTGTVSPTQVVTSPDGKFEVVSTGTSTNTVLSFPINNDGTLGDPVANAGSITTPFAAEFLKLASGAEVYLSTDIADVALSAFTFGGNGSLTAINQANASGITGVGAPCWLSITPSGSYAYVGNGSGAITSYGVSATGALTLLNAKAATEAGVISGVPAVAGDSWISADGKFLYTVYQGDDKLVAYAINNDGSLSKLGENVVGTSTHLSLQGITGV